MIKIENVGKRIREIRKNKNMTMLELGNSVGITENNISRYERGVIKDIPLENINKIAEALETNVYYLLTGDKPFDVNRYINTIEPILKKIELSKVKRNELIKEANQYIKEHNLENEPIHYDVPFNENTTDYELLDFLYMINSENIEIILSKNMEIKEIQKEIIEKTNKINNLEDIKEINAFVDIKYNKVGK